jgi:hypothetical protein
MSSLAPSEGLGVGGSVCCGKSLGPSGTGCHENPITSPSTRTSGSDLGGHGHDRLSDDLSQHCDERFVRENWGRCCELRSVVESFAHPSQTITKTSDSLIASYRMNTNRDPSGDHGL